ncbi:MAG: VWA domain-containing protein [Deltaproteobacteria bacterium]|nr:VWA domain-containing protein [Deltaproteobacteria bacterium]
MSRASFFHRPVGLRRGFLTLAWLVALACLAGAGAPGARAQSSPTRPSHLAVVLEASAAMNQPWLGTTRWANALESLDRELRSLPLGVTAGLWLATAGGPVTAVEPTSAAQLKALRLRLPPPGGRVKLGPAIRQAAAWLAKAGRGAVVVVAAARPEALEPGEASGLPVGGGRPYCQVVALDAGTGPGDLPPGLAGLALSGGGGLYRSPRPEETPTLLHRAFLVAQSDSGLEVWEYDEKNHPLAEVFEVRRLDRLAWRRGLPQRPIQLLPGVYELIWPLASRVGPAAPPDKARVAARGITRLWAGGQGELLVTARGPGGEDLDWRLTVVRRLDGHIVQPPTPAPLDVYLPAGFYWVKNLIPPLSWLVEVEAGAKKRLTVGPRSRLTLRQPGPGGFTRVGFQAVMNQTEDHPHQGYTGSPLGLLPGTYRVEVDIVPPLSLTLTLEPGEEKDLVLPAVGALYLPSYPGQPPLRFRLDSEKGENLGEFASGRQVPLTPGRYMVRLVQGGGIFPVTIRAGELTRLAP